MLVFTLFAMKHLLGSLGASDLLNRAHLYKNDLTPLPDTTLAEIVEADFTGYASALIVMNAPYINSFGLAEADAEKIDWIATGAIPANTIYGVYVLDQGGALIACERLPQPIVLGGIGAGVEYTLRATCWTT